MYNAQQIKTKHTLQVKFHQFLYRFKEILTLPEYKFMQDICLGIIKGQSAINHRIAGTLFEQITVKKTCERFTRHLNKEDLGAKLQSYLIKTQCRKFDSETGIIVDESDIIKAKAQKMEGLQRVRDGSTGKHDQLGYALLNMIAFQHSTNGYDIKPISSDLIARDLELDSVSQIIEDRLIEIVLASGNKGVYLFDRGYDHRNLYRFLWENGMSYIIRATGERHLILDGKEQSFLNIAKTVNLNMTYTISESNQQIACGIKRVKLRLNPHPRKHPDTIDTWLIVSRFSPDGQGRQGYFYFLCDFPSQPQLTAEAIVKKVLRMYRMRWKIEEMHRHIKQAYGWEKMQLTSYTRLKNMNQLLLVAMCYLYSLKKYAYVFLAAFPSLMKYSNKRWKQIFDFVYYRISLLLATCWSSVTRNNINPYTGNWLAYNQLEIDCTKNGGM
jgi:hypothetical protein